MNRKFLLFTVFLILICLFASGCGNSKMDTAKSNAAKSVTIAARDGSHTDVINAVIEDFEKDNNCVVNVVSMGATELHDAILDNASKEIAFYDVIMIDDPLMPEYIEKDIEGQEDYTQYDIPKFVMFSAHDSTCGAFMGYMRAVFGTEIRYPYFATNINLELTRKGDEKKKENYYIEYIINDESMLNISYINFTQKVNENMKSKEEIDKFCGFVEEAKEESGGSNIYFIVDIVLSVLSIILIILLIITIRKKSTQDIDKKDDNEMLMPPKDD